MMLGVMAGTMSSKRERPAITRGSGNVFADLGFKDVAEKRQTKLRLAYDQRHPQETALARWPASVWWRRSARYCGC